MIRRIQSSLADSPFLRNYFKVFSVDVMVKGAGILLLPVYLKVMTQEEFGLYGYLIAIISTFSIVFNLGVYIAQSKLYHEYPEGQRGSVLYTLNMLLLGFIVLLMLLVVAFDLDFPVIEFMFKNPIDYPAYRWAILLATVVSVYSMMLVNYFLTSNMISRLQLFNIARIVLVNAIVIGVLYASSNGDHALLRIQYAYVIEVVAIAVFAIVYIKAMEFRFDRAVAVKALAISLPIVASALLGLFINLSDRYFIEKFGSLKDLSIYNLAIVISGVVPFVFASFQNIWLPEFLKERDVQANRLRSQRVVTRLVVLFVVLSIATWGILKAALWTGIVDGTYETVLPLLPIVLLTSIITSLTPMYSNHLIYLDKLYLVVVVGIPVAVLSILLNWTLVPMYNIYGAAASSLVSGLCYLVSYALLSNKYYRKKLLANEGGLQ